MFGECLELQFMNKEFCWSWFNYVSRVVNYNFLQFFLTIFFPHANEFFFVFLLDWLMHFAWITINCYPSSVSRNFGFKVLTIYFVFFVRLFLFFNQKYRKLPRNPFPDTRLLLLFINKRIRREGIDRKHRINSELWHKRLKIWTNVWKIKIISFNPFDSKFWEMHNLTLFVSIETSYVECIWGYCATQCSESAWLTSVTPFLFNTLRSFLVCSSQYK